MNYVLCIFGMIVSFFLMCFFVYAGAESDTPALGYFIAFTMFIWMMYFVELFTDLPYFRRLS